MKVGLVIVSAATAFFSARYITKNYIKKKPRSTSVSKERLMQSRNQTMRLNELKMLKKRLDESRTETKSYEKSIKRLDTVFIELERLIEQDSSAHSESLLSRFSKQLRHLLHEGASHSISVEKT